MSGSVCPPRRGEEGLWASSLGLLVASKLAVSVYSLANLHIPWGGSWNPQCRAKCKGGTWAKLLFAPMGRANLLFESLCSANRISLEATLRCGHPATWPPSLASPIHTTSHQQSHMAGAPRLTVTLPLPICPLSDFEKMLFPLLIIIYIIERKWKKARYKLNNRGL